MTKPFRPGPGRRSRYDSPMPRSTFTAPVADIVFFRVYSGQDDTISRGVQEAVLKVVALDPEAAQSYAVAQWICERAEAMLGNQGQTSDQENVLKYVAQNYADLVAMYRAEAAPD